MNWIRWGAAMMVAGVALGAFGAHALRENLSTESRRVYETAVFYHLIHGLGLLLVGWMATLKPMDPWLRQAGWAFVVGILIFSGSLYVLSVTGMKKLGMITPFGGLAFLVGWACVALSAR